MELQDGDFMKIVHIVEDRRSLEVTIRGWIFRRTRKTHGVFNSKRNEVCWMIYIDEDDPRDNNIQGLEPELELDTSTSEYSDGSSPRSCELQYHTTHRIMRKLYLISVTIGSAAWLGPKTTQWIHHFKQDPISNVSL